MMIIREGETVEQYDDGTAKRDWVTLDDMEKFVREEMDYCGISDEHIKTVLKKISEKRNI